MHKLKPKHKKPVKKRVGRGGKRGTYSGKGMKGQKSRAGKRLAPVVRELIKRYPKRKGYRGVKRQKKPQAITLRTIAKKFSKDEVVSPASLLKKSLVRQEKGVLRVKIVGITTLKEPLAFKDCMFSLGAKKAIEKSKGTIA